mmetsp:Transcript_23592/g.34974  ORF Transcript_23592/g.34974 Transcript_23592/m.34974 type:complete len:181 (+) Transcript_23592:15-557(+)|eukprot:scaffold17881_cov148-Skeletonema_dohrnii-CCMP3373.AAC.10
MKASLISTPLALWLLTTTHQAHARPDAHQQFEHTAASGDIQKKKKIDRHKQREHFATDTRRTINHQISSGSIPSDNDFHISFHQRQIEKLIRLDQLHAQVSETLTAHHSGQRKLSDAELESHTKKQMALERKRKSLQEETPERYLERMKRQEEKLVKKVERKERRKEERFRMMMDGEGEL